MSKKVAMNIGKPRAAAPMDDWISNRLGADDEAPKSEAPPAPPEPMKRLTFDIPAGMHKRLKRGAADREQNIADILRALIDKEFPKEP